MNSPELLRTLAGSLLHFLWQGAAIAAMAAALLYVFRKPATRYLIGVSALGLMLLSFAVTFSSLDSSHELPAAATAARAPAAALVPPTGTFAPSTLPWAEGQAAADSSLDFAWLARGWLAGVFILALRIAFGLLVIEQLRRRNLVALPDALVERFQALQARLGLTRGIRYAQCHLVNVPAVIGFFRPVVLIPMRALTGLSPEQIEALIAHELGHIKRFDVAVNFVQVIAETLFFFHPAVWWLNKRIRADREDCCDDIAVAAGGSSVSYAKALASIVHWTRSDVPSFAMAATGGPVATRIARLLGMNHASHGARTAGVFTASLVLVGALIAGAASLGFTEPAQAEAAVAPPPKPETPPSPPSPPSPSTVAEPVAVAKPAADTRPVRPAKPARPATPARPASGREGDVAGEHHTSYLEEMRGADLGELNVDQLIALRSQDVTPQYIKDIRATGLKPSVDQLVAMKVQDVTSEYVKQVRDMGFEVNTDQIIGLKTQDVSPDFVWKMREMGFKVGADQIVAMKVHDVTPEFVKQMRDLGFKFNADELIAFRVHDITPDYVRQMRASGFDMDVDELIAMRAHDVTPEYRRSLESAGLKLDTDQLIHARVMDLTPDFVREAASHGFKNLNIDQLIALKNADVF